MPIKLNTASGGGVILTGANTASDKTITVPADDGTMIYANSSGNVGIGTSSPRDVAGYVSLGLNDTTGGLLDFYANGTRVGGIVGVSGSIQIGTATATPLIFNTDTNERARIDSSGNLLVGTTSGAGRLRVERSDNADVAYIVNTNGSFTQDMLRLEASRAATNAFNLIRARSNGVDQFFVSGNGVIYAQNTTVQSASDIRMKENIRESEEGLNVISALRPVRYDFKQGFGNDRKNQLGFIAQEVEPVFPDAVGEFLQNDESYKSVGPGALIPVLVKAIQEQQQMIETLQAKVAALEAK